MFKSGKSMVIELDGAVFLCSGSTLERLAEMEEVEGDIRFVSDCQGTVSRTQTVEAPSRYAEVMVRKQLQEAGDFYEPVSLITHWKKKKGSRATDIFFSALPARLYHRYLDRVDGRQDYTILVPLYAVLLSVLRNLPVSDPVAVAFQHGRFVDLVIGTRKRVFYANRCVAYDATREQMASLWQTVASDIEESEKENRIGVEKVLILTWLDSQVDPELPPGLSEKAAFAEGESVFFEERESRISFLKACRETPVSFSISRPREKISHYSRKMLPFLNVAALLLCLLFLSAQTWTAARAAGLRKVLQKNQEQITRMRDLRLPAPVPYEEEMAFVKTLAEYRTLPSLRKLVNDTASCIPENTLIDVLKANYKKGVLGVDVLAHSDVPFDKAHRGYREFGDRMEKMGYEKEKSDFQTTIHESHFVTSFKKKAR